MGNEHPIKIAMRRAGFVEVAPACGDCRHHTDEIQGSCCNRFCVLVPEGARCLHWQPADHWLRANPEVAVYYVDSTTQLSPSERAYLSREHSL